LARKNKEINKKKLLEKEFKKKKKGKKFFVLVSIFSISV